MKHEMDSSKKTVKKDSAQVIRVSFNISRWQPRPLTPKFNPEKHKGYVLKLMKLLADWGNRNIALTGTYGTGKSSIITGLLRYLDEISRGIFSQTGKAKILEEIDLERLKGIKPIVVSLPTLNKDLASSALEDPTEVTHATSPTNNIQREVVKQLLYREKPQRMRESNFRRIVPVSFTRKVATYTVFAALITFIIATFQGLFSSDPTDSLQKPCYYTVVFSIAFIFGWLIDWLVIYKPAIKSLSLNSTKIELDKGSVSYFDQYLDEIIYYFEQSGTNLVVFEDLDRYGQPYIFESLKELNELINIALQTGRDQTGKVSSKQPVRFLFATRDSALSSFVTPASETSEKTNVTETTNGHPSRTQKQGRPTHVGKPEDRVKFFDAIVPVVPFSGSYNAYQYLHDALTLNSECPIDQKLLEIVGREIVDYRVLNNVVNEFLVFAEELTQSATTNNGESFVELNELFALMVFKAVSPQEFELIPAGKSTLDEFQRMFEHLHQETLKTIDSERSQANHAISLDEISDIKAAKLDQLIQEYVETTRSHINTTRIFINGTEFPFKGESSSKYWTKFLKDSDENELATVRVSDDYNRGDDIGESFLRLIFPLVVAEDVFQKGPLEEYQRRLKILRKLEQELKFAGYREMYEALVNDGSAILAAFRHKFENYLAEFFPSDVVRSLIKEGYITHRYYLYSTSFVSGLNSPEAQVFITNNVERNRPVPYKPLRPADIEHLSNRIARNNSYFDSQAIYNGYLFCGLYSDGNFKLQLAGLARRLSEKSFPKDLAADFIRSIARNTPKQSEDLDPDFSRNSFNSLVFIAKHQNALLDLGLEVSGEGRPEELETVLLDAVILGMEDSTWLDSDRSIEIFRKHYSETSALSKSGVLSDRQLEVLVAAIDEKGIYLEDLTHLTSSVQIGIVEAGLVEITKPNIAAIAQLPGDMQALDVALDLEPDLFYRLVEDLSGFLHIAKELQVPVIKSPDQILSVLSAVHNETGDESSVRLLANSLEGSPLTPVGEIEQLPDGVVSVLLEKDWLQPSADVIYDLIVRSASDSDREETSVVAEKDIISFIEKKSILVPSNDTLKNKVVAEFIVSKDIDSYAGDQQLRRVKTLGDLEPLLEWTELGELTSSKVKAVVEAGLVERNSSSYASLKESTDKWSCWEVFLKLSKAEEWLSADNIGGEKAAEFIITCEDLPTALRQTALEIANANLDLGDRWLTVAKSTDPLEFQLTFEHIIEAINADDSEKSKTQLPLLAHLLADYDRRRNFDEFETGLKALGDEYAKLVTLGRGRAKLPNSELVYKAFKIVKREGGAANSIAPETFSAENGDPVLVYRKHDK